MRITITPTESQSDQPPALLYPEVSVMIPNDELTLDDMLELIRSALKASGFSASVVDRIVLDAEE